MHYVRFNGTKEQERGDFEEIVRYEDKAGAVGIVAELRDDLTEIDAATYETERAAIREYNAGLPPPQPAPEPAPTPLAQLVDALVADPNIADETKDVIRQISGGDVKVGNPIPLSMRVQ